jgi:PKD repeat protein
MPAGKFNITIGNLEKTVELRSKEQKKPSSEFSATPISGEAPLKVKFTDKSTGSPTSWKWYFGDRMYSLQQNPVHTYSKVGKYTVTLKTKNANGMDMETKAKYIIVSKESEHQSKNKNVKTEDIDYKEKQKKEK